MAVLWSLSALGYPLQEDMDDAMATDYDSVGIISTDCGSNSKIMMIDDVGVEEVIMEDMLNWARSVEDGLEKKRGTSTGDVIEEPPVDPLSSATVEEGQPIDVVETMKVSFKLKVYILAFSNNPKLKI
ncbi:hypothetical protein P691DRAFT_784859 [Macrolepiota fuliginosa MF-IS2]|uniref:Uncharacterized protein n=1 Tax=Macrolepiota fuliginosa MF-IS2 TaxID=1400762 RepID=A0A9P6C1M8_9AGAR|nr:hypothetical protein P691DRAFT_784859 [Macrolepiota fuliginosa MF-IS2]